MSGTLTWILGSVPAGADPRSLKRLNGGVSPGDKTVIDCDFSGPLAAIDCDRLLNVPGVNIIRNDGGSVDLYNLGTPAISDDGSSASVWLGGGTAGYEYLVSITVQSDDGQILTRSFIISCAIR